MTKAECQHANASTFARLRRDEPPRQVPGRVAIACRTVLSHHSAQREGGSFDEGGLVAPKRSGGGSPPLRTDGRAQTPALETRWPMQPPLRRACAGSSLFSYPPIMADAHRTENSHGLVTICKQDPYVRWIKTHPKVFHFYRRQRRFGCPVACKRRIYAVS